MKTAMKFSSLLALGLISACSGNENEKQTTPNIILIVADDLGYGDLSCYDGKEIETPNLDKLASTGVRLIQFYAGSAVCTPSRASILTGNSPLRFNIRQYFPREGYLPWEAVTIPDMLKHKNYYCAHIGKWHLGGLSLENLNLRNSGKKADPGPLEHGFDHYLTMYEGNPNMPSLFEERRVLKDGGKYLISNDVEVPSDSNYLTTIFTTEAIRIMEEFSDRKTPFFINLWYKIPHTPYEPAPEPHISKYRSLNYPEPENQNFHRGHNALGDGIHYNSMVSYLDAEIGRLIQKLDELGIRENTFIVFTSDNGPSYRGSPSPWTGGKADLHEGGIRVPMIASWPGKIPANTINGGFGHTNDLLPSFCEAAGIGTDSLKIDGVSIMDQLKGLKETTEHGMVFWQMDQSVDPWGNIWYPQPGNKPIPYGTCIVRNGKWKMHFDSISPVALYNLDSDSLEMENLLGTIPEVENKMTEGLKKYLSAPRLDNGRDSSDPKSL
jgi:arylsulfatase A-like enzyme